VVRFRPEKIDAIPGVVHADGTGRLQTVRREDDPRLHSLLRRFFEETGVPILINTSFNVMGEPIVETPTDALWCMLSTDISACAFGDVFVEKDPAWPGLLSLTPVMAEGVRLRPDRGEARVRTRWGVASVPIWREEWGVLEQIAQGKNALELGAGARAVGEASSEAYHSLFREVVEDVEGP